MKRDKGLHHRAGGALSAARCARDRQRIVAKNCGVGLSPRGLRRSAHRLELGRGTLQETLLDVWVKRSRRNRALFSPTIHSRRKPLRDALRQRWFGSSQTDLCVFSISLESQSNLSRSFNSCACSGQYGSPSFLHVDGRAFSLSGR